MRASTANRILLGVVGAMAAFGLLMLVAGDDEAVEMLRYVAAVGLTIGGFSWLGYHYRVLPRRESFQGQARELGLRSEPGDPLELLSQPFILFRWAASVREIENTARGMRRGEELVVADYWFAATSAPERDDYERYTCVLTRIPPTWPDLSVVPERIASRVRSALAMPDIRTESEEFNRRFEVRSSDRRFALAFVDARMMRWLLDQPPGIGFEIRDGWLMLFRPRMTTSVDDLSRAVELYDRLREQIPGVVRRDQL